LQPLSTESTLSETSGKELRGQEGDAEINFKKKFAKGLDVKNGSLPLQPLKTKEFIDTNRSKAQRL
jgi:hypothetical protein